MKRTKILLVLGVILISTTLVSAALLQYFGKVTTTMNVQQSIVVGDGEQWYDWDQPITRDLGDVVHCTDYCYKLWIKNQACKDADVWFNDIPLQCDPEGVTIHHYVFGDTQTILLTHKDAQWNPIGDPITLTYNTCGSTFDYSLSDLPQGYSLVYYIDQEDRFNNWGKVFVIGDTISGSVDIPSMPYAEDLNYADGAKFWLVPTCNLDDSTIAEMTYLDPWMHESYFYEESLGLYIDCNGPVVCMPCYPLFDTTVLKAESTYCWISCYHVAFDIVPGGYAFDTIVDAAEIVEV
jgi:hypothetical protein